MEFFSLPLILGFNHVTGFANKMLAGGRCSKT